MTKKLNNKNIIVTAAGQGIGRATAIAYSKEGANVTATDINEKTLKSLNEEFPNIKVNILDSTKNNDIKAGKMIILKFDMPATFTAIISSD